jgi:polyhydroxyalkanoate synthesis regulator phasin
MLDGLRSYLELATGLTEVTASKAREAAMSLVNQGLQFTGKTPDVMGSVQDIADDLVSTSKHNREMLLGTIRTEVDRAVGRMGFVREDELAAVRARVEQLEKDAKPTSQQASRTASSAGNQATSISPTVDEAPAPKKKTKKKVVPE